MPTPSDNGRSHERISRVLLLQTLLVFAAVMLATLAVWRSALPWRWALVTPLVLFQGLWLDRMWIAAHEAIHKKLFPRSPGWNDAWGTLLLFPVAAPFTVYRRIHFFHHGHNRRDHHTANLDTFVSSRPLTPALRAWYRAVWIWFVFLGGFFVHSLVSVLLFLLMPTERALRLSPAFKGWRASLRLRAWAELAGGIAFHVLVWRVAGADGWMVALGLPLAFFAWVWSLTLYVYHYGTTVGPDVRHNVRSLPRQRFFSWLLLNFNEHATHHYDPSIPWHLLPERRHVLPAAHHHANQTVTSIWGAIWQQWRGPLVENVAEAGEFSLELKVGRR